MEKFLILELFGKFEAACYLLGDTECWSARELQTILGYAEWRNFLNAIEKAKKACESAGEMVIHHFVDVNKMVDIGSSTQRRIDDIALTIKAKDFATELTNHNVVDKDLRGQPAIQREHIDNNLAVRNILHERGVKPEQLPPAEDVKKVERRLKSDAKKIIEKPDKIKTLPLGAEKEDDKA